MKKKIFVTRRLLKENEEKLKSLFDVTLNKDDKIYTPQEIISGSKKPWIPLGCELVFLKYVLATEINKKHKTKKLNNKLATFLVIEKSHNFAVSSSLILPAPSTTTIF